MLSSYVLLYQYFDSQEKNLIDQINEIQSRCIYRDFRNLDESETIELMRLKIKM